VPLAGAKLPVRARMRCVEVTPRSTTTAAQSMTDQSITWAPLIKSMNSWFEWNLPSLAVSCSIAST